MSDTQQRRASQACTDAFISAKDEDMALSLLRIKEKVMYNRNQDVCSRANSILSLSEAIALKADAEIMVIKAMESEEAASYISHHVTITRAKAEHALMAINELVIAMSIHDTNVMCAPAG